MLEISAMKTSSPQPTKSSVAERSIDRNRSVQDKHFDLLAPQAQWRSARILWLHQSTKQSHFYLLTKDATKRLTGGPTRIKCQYPSGRYSILKNNSRLVGWKITVDPSDIVTQYYRSSSRNKRRDLWSSRSFNPKSPLRELWLLPLCQWWWLWEYFRERKTHQCEAILQRNLLSQIWPLWHLPNSRQNQPLTMQKS